MLYEKEVIKLLDSFWNHASIIARAKPVLPVCCNEMIVITTHRVRV